MKREESILQQNCVNWFRYQYPRLRKLLIAVPNGGHRHKMTAITLKKEGVVAGVSDLILMLPRHGFHALCIEMKTPKGVQQKTQKEWQEAITAEGYKYVICRSFDQFKQELESYI